MNGASAVHSDIAITGLQPRDVQGVTGLVASPLEAKAQLSSGSEGNNVTLPTNTTLVYPDMIPTTTVMAKTHSNTLLEWQKVLECDCYVLLGHIMTNGIVNVIETLNKHEDLYKFYVKLKGFAKSLNNQDKNSHIAQSN